MRKITVVGGCDSAKILRQYLKREGVVVSAGCTVHLEEHDGQNIVCDSVVSELEGHVLRCVSELTTKDIILRRRGGVIRSEKEIRLLIPKGDEESAHAVEVGVLRGVQRTRNWWQRLLGTAVLLLALAGAAHAGPPAHTITATAEDGSVLRLNLPPDLFPQLQVPAGFTFTGTSLNVNCTGGCAGGGGGGTSSSFSAAFPATGTAIGVKNGANMVNLNADASGNLLVNLNANSFGTLTVTGTGGTFPVTGTFFQATQPVSCTAATCAINESQVAGTALGATAVVNYGSTPAAVAVPAVNAFVTNTVPVSGTVTTTPPANASTNLTQVAGTGLGATAIVNYGSTPAAVAVPGVNAFITNTPAVTLASTTVTNTVAVSGTVTTTPPANASTNVTQFGGTNVSTGTGVGGAGIPRVTVSSDSFPTTQAVSGTVTANQGGAPWSQNVTQFGGVNLSTGTGTSGTGIPRVTVSNDSNVLATQSGTWTVQPGNTANTTPWLATINQGGNSATVSAANALKVDGSAVTQPISGTVVENSTLPGQSSVIPVIVMSAPPPAQQTTNALLYRSSLRTYCYQNLAGCAPPTQGRLP